MKLESGRKKNSNFPGQCLSAFAVSIDRIVVCLIPGNANQCAGKCFRKLVVTVLVSSVSFPFSSEKAEKNNIV